MQIEGIDKLTERDKWDFALALFTVDTGACIIAHSLKMENVQSEDVPGLIERKKGMIIAVSPDFYSIDATLLLY